MSITCSDRHWGIAIIALNYNLYLFDGNLWVLWCLRCSLGTRGSSSNQIVARLRSGENRGGCLCCSQRLVGNDLLRKYLRLRWCYTRLLLYHEHGWRFRHLVIVWPGSFTSFALRWPLIISCIVVIASWNSMRASTCSTPRPLLLCFCSFRTSLDVSLRLLLSISVIWLRSQIFDSLLWNGTLWCCLLIFLRLSQRLRDGIYAWIIARVYSYLWRFTFVALGKQFLTEILHIIELVCSTVLINERLKFCLHNRHSVTQIIKVDFVTNLTLL